MTLESKKKSFDLADSINAGQIASTGSKLRIIAMLTWPAVMAQMSTIVMEYIDAAMVGNLGSSQAASIGLVSTTTWLFWGLGTATATGYAVQVSHHIGARRESDARAVFRQSFVVVVLLALALAAIGVAIAPGLPHWLGGNADICADSTAYFMVFALSLPVLFISFLSGSMLRCSGNMLVPGVANVAMCALDVCFNAFLIYPTREVSVAGIAFTMPGAGWGVTGAAAGTMFAEVCAGGYMLYYLLCRSSRLAHPYRGAVHFWTVTRTTFRRACTISWPIALERVVMCGAQILITAIVAPLGTAAIAANSFGITAEALCYMPGYGLSDASTTLVGQSLGAGKPHLARSFARITVTSGMLIMGLLGVAMWLLAPTLMGFFTQDAQVVDLGTMALRTEAWAEPMFGAAIVVYGAFVGAGYTFVPSVLNLGSMWVVRITLSAILAPVFGLFGVWLAMAIELTVRGSLFLIFFIRGHWLNHAHKINADTFTAEQAEFNPEPFEL